MGFNEEIKAKVDYEFSHRCNHTLHAYIDIAEDLIAGTLLSQIMYWFSDDKDGNQRVRVHKDGYYWLAKGREDWIDEIRISKKQYDNAIKKLKDKGLVETRIYKFNAVPTTHIRPIYENINSEINSWKDNIAKNIEETNKSDFIQVGNSDLPKGENGNSPNGKKEFTQTGNSLTDITNNKYNNRDYNTENTNTSPTELNTSKDDLSASQFNTSFPEKKDVESRPEKKKSEFKWVAVKNQIVSCMHKLGYSPMSDETEDAIETFRYYYMKYKDKTGENHPILNEKTMISVLQRFLRGSHDVGGNFDEHAAIIEAHFDYDYASDIDWHIQHFMTEDIRNILYQRTK